MILSPNDGNHTSWARYLWRNRRPRGAPVGRANAALAAEFQYFHRKTIARADSRARAAQARRRPGESRAGLIAGRKGARDYGRRRGKYCRAACWRLAARDVANRLWHADSYESEGGHWEPRQ